MHDRILREKRCVGVRAMLLTSSLLAAGWCSPAASQSAVPNVPPPSLFVFDENSVSMTSGMVQMPTQAISIGPESDPLKFEDYSGTGLAYHNLRLDIFSSWPIMEGPTVSASIMNNGTPKSESFSANGPDFVYFSKTGNGSILNMNGSTNTVTISDGTKYIYGNTEMQTSDAGGGWIGRISEIVKPNGTKTNFFYKKASYTCPNSYCPSTGGSQETKVRLQSIVRSDGYQIHFNYMSNLTSTGTQQRDWNVISSAVAFNRSIDFCGELSDTCTFTKQWPSLVYQRNSVTGDVSITTPLGTAIYGSDTTVPFYPKYKYQRPGSLIPNKIVEYGSGGVGNLTNNGITYKYSWTSSPVGDFIIKYSLNSVRENPDGTTRTVFTDAGASLPTSVTDELGNVWRYTYDTYSRLTKATAPSGRFTSYTYDARGNVTSVTNVAAPGSGLPDIITMASFPAICGNVMTCNRPIWTRDALGNQTDYTYDPGHGGVLTVTGPADASGARPQVRYSYAPVQAFFKNSAGSIVPSGLPIYKNTEISTCISASSANYSSCVGGQLEKKTSTYYGPQVSGTANNLLPLKEYISSGDYSLISTTDMTYDYLGNLTSIDGPLTGGADTTVFRYDAASRLVGVVMPDPDGSSGARESTAQRITFNPSGQVALLEKGTVADQSDAAWGSFSSQQQVATAYDLNARPVQTQGIGAGGISTLVQQNYDVMGRVKCRAVRMDPTQWLGQTDACIPQISGSSGPDRVTQTSYDSRGQITSLSEAFGTADAATTTTNSYASNGQIVSVKDGSNNTTTYEYDGFDRLAKTRYPVTEKGAGTSSVSDYEQLTYNANSLLTQRRLRDGAVINYSYDNLDRLVLKNLPGSEADAAFTYDLLGRPLTAVQGSEFQYFGHDALGRRLYETLNFGTISYGYDIAGRRTNMIYPGGALTINYDYDVTGNVTAIRENGAMSGAGVLARYAYDSLGRRSSVTFGNGSVQSFGYDATSRLSTLINDLGGGETAHDLTQSFAYNTASQIVSTTRSSDAYAWQAHYNIDRAYVADGLNRIVNAGGTGFSYDVRGNLTSSGSSIYGYNSENLMVSGPGGFLAGYDPLGRLKWTATATTGSNYFIHDGTQLISELNASGTPVSRYVHGPGTDNPIVWYNGSTIDSATRRFLMADERGSIVSVTDSTGATVNINSYDEYGIPAPGNIGRFGYTGQAWLPEVGMWYYKARIYSPTLGRFMQTDPIGYGDGMNWYNYVHSDPVNGVDPFGLEEGGGQQTIVVSGMHSFFMANLAGMNLSLNISFAAPVFGGVSAGQGLGFTNAGNQTAPAPAADEEIVVTARFSLSELRGMRSSAESTANFLEWYMTISLGLMAPEMKAGSAAAEAVATKLITNPRIRGLLTGVATRKGAESLHDRLVDSIFYTYIDMEMRPWIYPLEMQSRLGGGYVYFPN